MLGVESKEEDQSRLASRGVGLQEAQCTVGRNEQREHFKGETVALAK